MSKNILITGAGSGIGRDAAFALAVRGHQVWASTETAAQAQSLRAEILAQGVSMQVLQMDITQEVNRRQVQDLAIDVLVPCAAIETLGLFVDATPERHQQMVQMNVIAPMHLARHYGQGMAQRQRGAILFVSSLSGWMPQPFMAQYGATKSYIMGLAAGLHFEMKDQGVDVSVLSPGPTDTPMAKATGIDFASMGMSIMGASALSR